MESSKAVLLIGGTGKVGRKLTALFKDTSIPTFKASRNGEFTTEPVATNIKSVAFDWENQTTWSSALEKSNPCSVYLVAPQFLDMLPPMQAFIDMARSKGVKRFVLLSGTRLDPDINGLAIGRVHAYLEQLGAAGQVEWASLRPTWFQQNLAEQPWHVKSIQEENSFYSATGEGKIPWISTVDIAACAFELLTQDEAPNSEYLLLGPELLSYNQIADILTEVVGRKIVHKDISAEELDERRSVFGMPRDYAQMVSSLDTDIKKGSEDRLNNVVEEMTGKPPGKFRDFAEQNKHVWIRG
ncbi:family ergot alkaloid biosynthesis protein [Dactylonectria macrodidyma]|uniref:Family ergot alkaloid biosynthesis protein n=1 Tax=Dactylonectria macrodidyma TaxID=307937 RepID=A0A9P9IMJ4_9HYPO|nr:family ergot alkaloid biosynthesis protein [Dactylonectria macrodidyma]